LLPQVRASTALRPEQSFGKIGVPFPVPVGSILSNRGAVFFPRPREAAVMAADRDTLVRFIHRLVVRPETEEATDAALLSRFISGRDERAFTALVNRHGPLVLQVCRRVLGDSDDTEDAFQAVFLVLARKAATVRREALAAWLHGVARRVALKARSARARRFHAARPLAAPPADARPDPLAELSARELLLSVDEELQRLPEVYRLPVILCCLEGRSLEEAAHQLGWTPGSVKGRLERGRARLRTRLLRRGLTLSAALAAVEVSRGAASAMAVAQLVARTVRGAVAFGTGQTAGARGVPAGAAALAGQVVKGMALARLKMPVALLLAMCLLATGLALFRAGPSPPPAAPPVRSPFSSEDNAAVAAPAALAGNQPGDSRDEADAPIEVSGRVLDSAGKPFAGAKLYVGYSARRYGRDFTVRQTVYPLRATSGAEGWFHFAFARSELDARWLDDSRPAVMAVAGGYGPAWAEIGEPGRGAELSLKLVEDLPVDGRILDQNRQPVAGARVLVVDVTRDSEEEVTRFLQGGIDSWSPRSWRGPLPGQPPGVTTDADGRFRLTGLGRDRVVHLALVGPTISHSTLAAVTRPPSPTPFFAGIHGAAFDYVARPSLSIRGVVRDQATGQPVAGVKLTAAGYGSTALTDEDGRYELPGCSRAERYFVYAQPQAGQPYFAASAGVPDAPGLDSLTANLELVGGIRLQGRLTDQATQKPPRTAVVEYYPLFPNPHCSRITGGTNTPASSAFIGPDGSYSLVVLPGPGVVCMAASPRNSYAVARIDDNELANLFHDGKDHGGGQLLYTAAQAGGRGICCINKYHALSLINPDEGAEALALEFTLQPARALEGTVVGPEGQPLTGVRVVGLTAMADDERLDSASFTVTGLNPQRSRDLFFHHGGKGLGKVLTIRGDETEALTVQLDPCGSVTGRMVDSGANPVPGVTICFLLLRASNGPNVVAETDTEGRFRAALVPGARYSLLLSSRRLLRNVGEVAAESGRSKDLGDLPLAD
jgi:RNA polymerase sigma factor (sigma-70 family)